MTVCILLRGTGMSTLHETVAPMHPAPSARAPEVLADAAGRRARRHRNAPRALRWALFALLGLGAAALVVRSSRHQALMPDGLLVVNGRLEGDNISVAGKEGGRVTQLLAREGDAVQAGQELARLDDAALRTREAQARAALDVAERRASAARVSLEVAQRQVGLDVETARTALAVADAAVLEAVVAERQAQSDDERGQALLGKGVIERQEAEQRSFARERARAEHAGALAERQRAQRGVEQALLGHEHLRERRAELEVLQAEAARAAAELSEVITRLDELSVESPISGTVTRRYVNLGEVVAPSTPLYEVVDLDGLFLRAYVPERAMGLIPLGAHARVHTDAAPDQPVAAELRYVSSRAEFTPKEVQTPDERVKLVYAVKLYLVQNPEHRLTPGLSADAVIRYREDVPWAPPRW